ncbi:MAG: ATP-binding protein [Planctomycetes bacterium]|nr:ATP-binding protein [Planctomycetota bacterium]
MLEKCKRIMLEFQERQLPPVVRRDAAFPVIAGKATVITGMRRVGKTSFCRQKMRELLDGGWDKSRLLYLNFEDDRLFGFRLEDCQSILDAYYNLWPDNRDQECWFFFDEIQNVQNWERFVRRLLDTTNVHVVLTGSSAKLLTAEIATAMRGRSINVELLPFSFTEFLRARGTFAEMPKQLSDDVVARLRHGMEEYFAFGGFPEVYQLPDAMTRAEVLQGYSNMVVLKDVIERYQVGKPTALRHLLAFLYNHAARKFSISGFWKVLNHGMQIKCPKNDLFAFVDYLEEAYLLFRTELHTASEKARIVNPDKIYLTDVGLARAMADDPEANRGWLLENLVYLELRRRQYVIEYYNVADGREVDFLATDRRSRRQTLIQASWSMSAADTAKRETTALRKAGQELGIAGQVVVTWDEERELDDGIRMVPIWKLLSGYAPL